MPQTQYRHMLRTCVSWAKWRNYFLCVSMRDLKISVGHCFAKALHYNNSCHFVMISYPYSTFTQLLFNFPCSLVLDFIHSLWCCLQACSVLAVLAPVVQSSMKNWIRQDLTVGWHPSPPEFLLLPTIFLCYSVSIEKCNGNVKQS